MSNKWTQFLEIEHHPFLRRFENASTILRLYKEAVYGLPRLCMYRREEWYGYAKNTAAAIERLGMMIEASLRWTEAENLRRDLLKTLEDCEEPASIHLIEKIFAFYPHSPFESKQVDLGVYRPEPASEKQRAYLKRLGHPRFSGTKTEASKLIDRLVAERDFT